VIQPVPAPTKSAAAKSPPVNLVPTDLAPTESPLADAAPAESSTVPLHSAAGTAPTETS
jgi:hypothetical protein